MCLAREQLPHGQRPRLHVELQRLARVEPGQHPAERFGDMLVGLLVRDKRVDGTEHFQIAQVGPVRRDRQPVLSDRGDPQQLSGGPERCLTLPTVPR